MFVRPRRWNLVLSALFILGMGACGNIGGCGACGSVGPLPTGGLPKDQTIEGGAQVRVTPAGFGKLQSVLLALLGDQLEEGFCVPRGQVGSMGTLGTGALYCTNDNGEGCNPACKINVGINSLVPSVTNQQKLNVKVSTSVSTSMGIDGQIVGIGFSCTLGLSSNNLSGDFDIAFGIKPDTGELDIHLAEINEFQLNMDFSGCGPLSDIADFAADVIDSFLGQFIIQLLTPTIDDLLQGIIPAELGLAGMLDVGSLLSQVSPGTSGFMEARIIPGGYANLVRNGLSLGVITGLNADEDPATRMAGLTSEPHLCVPPLPPPNFSAAPGNLPQTSRATYALNAAGAFDGLPEPSSDLAMGISETMLDLAGHHAVTSGLMCLGIGTTFVKQLNLGTIGILTPSLAELGSKTNNDPLLLVTRPQRALDFKIGDNTPESPAITIGISNLEVDFYAFIYQRYIRAFTMDLSMDVGVNLEFEQAAGMPVKIKPSLVGISSQSARVKVLNSQFLAEPPARLESVLPSVFDLITPLLGNLPAIDVPSFAGFSLEGLSIQKVTTPQDDFLALNASIATSPELRQLGAQRPRLAQALRQLDGQAAQAAGRAAAPARSTGSARLVRVSTPEPGRIRAAMANEGPGSMPEVEFAVDRVDAAGRELEWSYNLNGGMWRPYVAGGPMIVRDRAFAWQGQYMIGLKSRVKGDYRTVSEPTVIPVTIDSAGPRVVVEEAGWKDERYEVALWDVVSERNVSWALGAPGASGPGTAWRTGPLSVSREELAPHEIGGEVAVYARDEVGNQTVALIAPFHGQPGETGGCGSCEAGRGPSAGGVLLVLLVGGVLLGSGRRRQVLRLARTTRGGRYLTGIGSWLGLSVVLSLAPGCSCGEKVCELDTDCVTECEANTIGFCLDGVCECIDDVPLGRIGPYSDVAAAADGSSIWVSAYSELYGDLVVARVEPGRVPDEAWEWVDGTPDGPVTIQGSKYRGGITAKGTDTGMYTSIAVAADGSPMVTYFEPETASLRFAIKRGDVWEKHTIDAGTKKLAETSGQLVGMYSSISVRSDDGRPGVAYLAHVADENGVHAEVRFAAAQVPVPKSADEWLFWVVDSAPLPPVDPRDPDVYPLPGGLGLFVDLARLPSNQAPVVVYYDRSRGELKMAQLDQPTGVFLPSVTLDGGGNIDAGWQPTVAIGADDRIHVAYIGSTGDDLKYITNAPGATASIIDDGYRLVGTTVDGHPKPEWHFVGEDATLVMANDGTLPMVVYQDATTQELLLGTMQQNGMWMRTALAGAKDPWPGAYGFFASGAVTGRSMAISNWVINQQTRENWVEVFLRPTVIQ